MVVMLLTTSMGLPLTLSQKHLRNQVDHSLVDSHLEMLPAVGTLTARGLAGGDAQELGGHADGTGHLHLLIKGNALDIGAHYSVRRRGYKERLPFSTGFTLVEVRVMRIRWTSSLATFSFSIDIVESCSKQTIT